MSGVPIELARAFDGRKEQPIQQNVREARGPCVFKRPPGFAALLDLLSIIEGVWVESLFGRVGAGYLPSRESRSLPHLTLQTGDQPRCCE